MKTVAIIGGGITGLAAAFYLQREAQARGQEVRCTLLESQARLGGKIITDRTREFTIEGGPDSFIVDKPWCLQLCHDAGLGDDLIPSNDLQRKVYVLRKGRLVEFPTGFRLTVPTELMPFVLSPLISPLGKLRMLGDLVIPPRRDKGDESLATFIRRRLGAEALDRIAGPLLGGIFVSDPERLSMDSTFPRLQAMEREYGSLIRAGRAVRNLPPPTPKLRAAGNAMFNSLKHGMGSLVDALTRQIQAEVRLQTPVAALRREGGRYTLFLGPSGSEQLQVDAVIVTSSSRQAGALLGEAHPRLAALLNGIRFVNTTTVSMAYLLDDIPDERPLDGFGVLIPASEQRRLIAVTWASTKFRHRAPAGCVLLRAFVGGYRDEALATLPEEELLTMIRQEYESLFGITQAPMFHRVYRWPQANPQYDVGHLERVAEIEREASSWPGLVLAGSSYRGVGMPDCINGARQAVERVLGLP